MKKKSAPTPDASQTLFPLFSPALRGEEGVIIRRG